MTDEKRQKRYALQTLSNLFALHVATYGMPLTQILLCRGVFCFIIKRTGNA